MYFLWIMYRFPTYFNMKVFFFNIDLLPKTLNIFIDEYFTFQCPSFVVGKTTFHRWNDLPSSKLTTVTTPWDLITAASWFLFGIPISFLWVFHPSPFRIIGVQCAQIRGRWELPYCKLTDSVTFFFLPVPEKMSTSVLPHVMMQERIHLWRYLLDCH